MSKYEKGSLGWLKEKAKKDGFDSVPEWNDWKKAKKDGFDSVPEWNDWKKKKENKLIYPCSKEFQEEAKKLGLTGNRYIRRLIEEGKLPSPTDLEKVRITNFLKKYEFDNRREYDEFCAKKLGYENLRERRNEYRYNKGIRSPISEYESWNVYLGDIAEKWTKKILELKFGGIEKEMSRNNPGFEFITKGGHKIDSKARTLSDANIFRFKIDYNNMADYFLLWGFDFDDREGLILLHIWLIHKDELINGRKFWRRYSFNINNDPIRISEFEKYELKEGLEEIKKEKEKDGGW